MRIRQFKAKLSRYLRDVRRGESLYITDRGEIIADLSKPGSAGRSSASSAVARLLLDADRGD